jgi:DNA-binding protein HU-beta
MTKSELISKVASEAGISNSQAESAISSLFSTIVDSAKGGDKVAWPGFGTFSVKARAARTGRNPATGATISIAASKVMHFGAASGLKTALNG